MPPPARLRILAVLTCNERAAVLKAAELLESNLSAASATPWQVSCEFSDSIEALDQLIGPVVFVTSLLSEVDRADESWAQTETRLRLQYRFLCEDAQLVVFVCTVFRHISGDDCSAEVVASRRIRIRRLNLLAAELSRETGLLVIDIDRDLADVGARALQTDHRLAGQHCQEVVGKSMAMALLLIGLDEHISVETQEAARELVRVYQPSYGQPVTPKLQMSGGSVASMRAGRRGQIVERTIDTIDENVIAAHIHGLLKGHITLLEGFTILMRAVRAKGFRSSAARLLAGVRKLARDTEHVRS